ncbi:MAG: [protein-PII] uridylyltransferase [Verrucomicrobia bacterium]|nr:[protein-PII] uridylyltransferase [Verrucomicrobiota bacterium]MBV8376584.1 [protein-PII] uridylyltransferase [Verrucomicrobiota bacterium]
MSQHLEKILAHAERQLTSEGSRRLRERLDLYKKFLKIEEHRLRLKHYSGAGGLEIVRDRAALLDIVLRHLFEGAMEGSAYADKTPPIALLAIGGYGRGELNPYSDVDILFLHDSARLSREATEGIEQVLYMLWDVGFKVGHSTRSIDEAIKLANSDVLTKTSLLESRFLAGDHRRHSKFRRDFFERCVRGQVDNYLKWRLENQDERHRKYGGSVFMQEPNIKNGCGGLRDYHNVQWICYFRDGVMNTTKLVERKYISESDRRAIDRAYDFLLRVRTELHYLSKRPSDLLTLFYQGQIANSFHYPQKNVLRRSESFMRDYYQHARTIYLTAKRVTEGFLLPDIGEKEQKPVFGFLAKRKLKTEHFDGFYSHGRLIYFENREIFHEDPFRLIRVFLYAQQRELELSSELQQLIRRRTRLVNRTFQYARAARETFQAILSRKGQVGHVLRMMHEVDFLGKYLPEFGELTCLVQHEFFHRYTADEHTLVCIEKLDSLIDTKDAKLAPYKSLFLKLEDPYVLYLALLLHDTGKASGARHHAEASALNAQKVAARLQLSPERRRKLIFLVDHHMTLSEIAQRRNLEDSTTIADFAEVVRNPENLDALMLLTLADGQGTGGQNWSDWKETLVWTLYHATSSYLHDEREFFAERQIAREDLQQTVAKKMAKDCAEEIEVHFNSMPDRYFQSHNINEIVGHIRLFRSFVESRVGNPQMALAAAVKWHSKPDQGHSEVWICTWDRAALMAKIAGSFATASINILSADVYTRVDNLVLAIFRVCDTSFRPVSDERDLQQVESVLLESLEKIDYDFTPLLEKARKRTGFHMPIAMELPTKLMISNEIHSGYTVIDLQTADRLGLLYDVLMCLSRAQVNIALSRIATEKGAAFDSFYVTDLEGRKITDETTLRQLQTSLLAAGTGGEYVKK